jgi:hypothetical protein
MRSPSLAIASAIRCARSVLVVDAQPAGISWQPLPDAGSSQQVCEIFGREVGLAQDRSQCSGGQVTVAVDGDGDERAAVGSTKVVMTSARVGLFVAGAAERFEEVTAADSRQSSQGAATSISTTSS